MMKLQDDFLETLALLTFGGRLLRGVGGGRSFFSGFFFVVS
jgi:hypothetical protein